MKRSRDVLQARAGAGYGKAILAGGVMIAGLAVALTIAAIRFEMPFAGLGAILVTFGGLTWLSIAALRWRFARFQLRRDGR